MRYIFLLFAFGTFALVSENAGAGGKDLELTLRTRKPTKEADYKIEDVKRTWSPKSTAVIVVDMWDTHHSYNAVQRVVEIADGQGRHRPSCCGCCH